jgi:hypothetical protein
MKIKKSQLVTSATRQVRQQWFSVCIFPLKLSFGLTGNRPQSAPACSFLRVCLESTRESGKNAVQKMEAFCR